MLAHQSPHRRKWYPTYLYSHEGQFVGGPCLGGELPSSRDGAGYGRHNRIGRNMNTFRCIVTSICLLPALGIGLAQPTAGKPVLSAEPAEPAPPDRKSTRLNSSHLGI